MYCQKDFHQLKSLQNSHKTICWKCMAAQKEHGDPMPCHFCQQKAAFGQKICRHCQKDSEKYGTPIQCENCKKMCAFKKPNELKEKVGGKNLCYLCTRSYKLMQHRNKKDRHNHNKGGHLSSKQESIDLTNSSTPNTTNSESIINGNGSNKRSFDNALGGDLMDNGPNKRQKIGNSTYNGMCFNCKSLKEKMDDLKKSMDVKLTESNKRADDVECIQFIPFVFNEFMVKYYDNNSCSEPKDGGYAQTKGG